jgi:hypothetical protein
MNFFQNPFIKKLTGVIVILVSLLLTIKFVKFFPLVLKVGLLAEEKVVIDVEVKGTGR